MHNVTPPPPPSRITRPFISVMYQVTRITIAHLFLVWKTLSSSLAAEISCSDGSVHSSSEYGNAIFGHHRFLTRTAPLFIHNPAHITLYNLYVYLFNLSNPWCKIHFQNVISNQEIILFNGAVKVIIVFTKTSHWNLS